MAIKPGDKVTIEYEGSFDNGEIFDSSKHGEHSHPIEFEVGSGKVIPGFDKAVMGMKKGEEKKFSVEPKDAYGERKEELKREIPKNALQTDQEPEEGMTLLLKSPDGRQVPAKIIKADKEKLTIDLNHPLAGKKLNFKIKVVGVS